MLFRNRDYEYTGFFAKTQPLYPDTIGLIRRPRIICNDGFSMSVQANWGCYCEPRNDGGVYLSAEIGFPSGIEQSIIEYAENPSDPTDSVYGYVPIDVINDIIIMHDGINQTLTFNN